VAGPKSPSMAPGLNPAAFSDRCTCLTAAPVLPSFKATGAARRRDAGLRVLLEGMPDLLNGVVDADSSVVRRWLCAITPPGIDHEFRRRLVWFRGS
jgi:hypothetical protein